VHYRITDEAVKFLKQKDPRMKRLVELAPTPREYMIDDAFTALVDIIVGQQISETAKASIKARLDEAFAPIEKNRLKKASVEDLRQVGLSRMKARTILNLAKSDVDFNELKTNDKQTIQKTLLSFKGIGKWSVEMFFFVCLRDANVLSLSDMGIRNALKTLYGCGDDELDKFPAYFHPHESAAASYLWTMLDLDKETIKSIKKDV